MNSTGDGVKVNCLIFGILECFVATSATIINGLLLIVLYRDPFKSFRRPFSVLITGLAVTDFLKGLFADSIAVWLSFHCAFGESSWLNEDWNFYTVLDYALDSSATLIIILFAGDRLLAIAVPLLYRRYITAKKVALAVLGVWLYAFLFTSLQFSGISDNMYDLLDSSLHIIVAMTIMIVIHILIYYFLQKRRKDVDTTRRGNEETQETPRWVLKNQRLEKNFRLVALVITLILVVTQLPWLSLVLMKVTCKNCEDTIWYENYDLFANFALSLTSAINPILYCWRLQEYRRALKALVTCGTVTTSSLDDPRIKNSVKPNVNSNTGEITQGEKDLNSPERQS